MTTPAPTTPIPTATPAATTTPTPTATPAATTTPASIPVAAQVEEVQLEILNYVDSAFTRAHDLTSHAPVHDGRGTFTHVGVKMEGVESSRNWNFFSTAGQDGLVFWRDHRVANHLFLQVVGPSSRVLATEIEFDTSFYTENNVRNIYSVIFFDQLDERKEMVVDRLLLNGNENKRVKLNRPIPVSRIAVKMGEGGLTRLRVFGTPLPALPERTNVLKGATLFGISDESLGEASVILHDKREGMVMTGWRTKRHGARHVAGIQLAKAATVRGLLIDTYMHCLSNFPYITVLACNSTDTTEQLMQQLPKWRVFPPKGEPQLIPDQDINEFMKKRDDTFGVDGNTRYQLALETSTAWHTLLPTTSLKRDTIHTIEEKHLHQLGPITHLVIIGIPDGGLHRFVVYGDFI
eukprot:TRINITY_DN1662_c0_g1_i1.p1 TRINITY_DN1662_c0_g1~~TRINITY_DN1662_c0_g1_i1.p1  ORF type:complete len:406 (+),score=76.16 TRINITY_DN1662_c0_g1_i1:170-1387(+)